MPVSFTENLGVTAPPRVGKKLISAIFIMKECSFLIILLFDVKERSQKFISIEEEFLF